MTEAETLPRFLRAAQKLADQRGTSVEEVLLADERGVLRSEYPTPECLLPHEVEALIAGGSRADAQRLSHLEACASCAAVLQAAAGNDDELARIKSALRCAAAAPESATEVSPTGSPVLQAGIAVAGGLALTAWGVRRWLGRDRSAPSQPAAAADRAETRAKAAG